MGLTGTKLYVSIFSMASDSLGKVRLANIGSSYIDLDLMVLLHKLGVRESC